MFLGRVSVLDLATRLLSNDMADALLLCAATIVASEIELPEL